ncbi:GNAT family N-acetyltransferase [Streptomyces californicus]|uniref:GNAT family N-acetyltransferase n=1 Tax=Streptomyces californicus TaxID=67351 RepID=A0ABD7D856_9ACTN|nr:MULTISPECIES: GNAT family N-acetyltransferase [Streptomyces]QRV31867.1 GNAT family N-acetyltransferase [Streptomyces californicus]QRV38970.1 GNAT family N-acetyltransferase [Streptomyces californicus]QRV45280.1 GNAT family N-acetyltransferase [Streptomyces californicus]QRV51971.1 GNAT family N-acetyltransferase [Streptomyces californicus]
MTSTKSARRPHHWRRDLIELAALFTAVAVADAIANLIGHQPDGPFLLMASAVALVATAAFHTWWARRHSHAPPPDTAGPVPGGAGTPAGTPAETSAGTTAAAASGDGGSRAGGMDGAEETVLWRLRTTVHDAPGSLAALCLALSGLRVDILTLQTHPLAHGTVDEFLLRAPAPLQAQELSREIAAAGGTSTWIERADAHDLVDTPTRVLSLATRTALDAAELPLALRQLLGRCTIHSLPAVSVTGRATGQSAPVEGVLEETVMRLRDPSGGVISVERPHLPFTPTEFARARALVELDARLGPRVPRGKDVLTLPEGDEITVRRADRGDLAAARAMHDRCSPDTLGLRYHGPVKDADRYLDHLLSPRFGRTLAVRTASGRVVALGHLLWDGDETEVALLVEDEWQRRGIGSELLARLVAMAGEAGCDSVYAVTQSRNTGMVAAMRALGLPLDYQIEEGTLVITARLTPRPAARPAAPTEEARR